MRKFVATVLYISLMAIPHVTFAQKSSDKQLRAEKIADRFVERFQQTLDFGIVWKEFRLSDPPCTHRANGNLGEQTIGRAVKIAEVNLGGQTFGNYRVNSNEVGTAGVFTESLVTFAPGAIKIEAQVTVSFCSTRLCGVV